MDDPPPTLYTLGDYTYNKLVPRRPRSTHKLQGLTSCSLRSFGSSSSFGIVCGARALHTMSIMHLLADRAARCSQGAVDVDAIAGEVNAASPASSPFSDVRVYINFLKESIDSGRLQMEGQTIVTSSHPFVVATALSRRRIGKTEPETIADELASLALCPDVFVWAPDKLVHGFVITCPACMKPVPCAEWAPDRPLHTLGRQMAYIIT